MDPITIIKITRTVIKYGSQIVDYIRDDQTAKLGLNQPVRMVVEGPGVGIGYFRSADGVFTMLSPTLNRVDFKFSKFPPDAESVWNGPDLIPNDWDGGSVPASLVDDFTKFYRREIAAELSLTDADIWDWSTAIMAVIWDHYGHYTTRAKTESWLAYHLIRPARRPYQWIKRRLGFACVILAALASTGCTGCLDPRPAWHVTYADPVISIEQGIVTTNTPSATIAP